ncbi:MAG TPA: DUF4331 family protein [Thermomicrobiales bacterium]|nr:DUF4331 family protein [Thermomicrobiales bacterium]
MRTLRMLATYGLAAIALLVGVVALPSLAADHLDAPLVKQDGRIDITDLYAFQSPANPAYTVLILNVNPLAGVQSPMTFHPDASYDFKIDTTGTATESTTLSVTFSKPDSAGRQTATLRKDGTLLASGPTETNIPVSGGGMMRAGLFSDPFFFDLAAFKNGLKFCPGGKGTDFFKGLNVTGIVLELPSSMLGPSKIGVWVRTAVNGQQLDRMGRPAINTVLMPEGKKDAFNAGVPANDRRDFRADVVATLKALGNDDARAGTLADALLPDILTVDTSSSAGFLNGRKLSDDVIDAELALLTNGKVTTDCVGQHADYRNTFPYMGPPNAVSMPSPSPMPGLPNTGGGAAREQGGPSWLLIAGLGVLAALGVAGGATLAGRRRDASRQD